MKRENKIKVQRLVVLAFWATMFLAACGLGKAPTPSADNSSDKCEECGPNETCVDAQCRCAPACDGKPCGANDGCGGTCACEGDLVRNAQGNLVRPSECHDTCESAGWACGELCGRNCGGCGDGKVCGLTGACECIPHCDGTSCSDGCGGTCACAAGTVCNATDRCVAPEACKDTCASSDRSCGSVCGSECGACKVGQSCVEHSCTAATTCESCTLNAHLVDRKVEGGMIREITLAVEYKPTESGARARIADLRIRANRPVELVSAEAGKALTESGRELYVDQETGRAFQKLPNGAYQLLAYGFGGADSFASGTVALLKFTTSDPGPIKFSFDRRVQTLAPADADAELQASSYEQALVVSQ